MQHKYLLLFLIAGVLAAPSRGSSQKAATPVDVKAVDKNGVRMAVHRVEVRPRDGAGGSALVTLACRSNTLDRGLYAGLQEVRAEDDTGQTLYSDLSPWDEVRLSGDPNETYLKTRLSVPAAGAKKLRWLEGQLATYDSAVPVEATFPLPPQADRKPESQNGVTFELGEFLPGKAPMVRGRLTYPRGSFLAPSDPASGRGLGPVLVGVSGKAYRPHRSGGGNLREGDREIINGRWIYPEITEPLKAVQFHLYLKRGREILFKFRMTDIPLPISARGRRRQFNEVQ